MSGVRVAVDVGGTFTDVVRLEEGTGSIRFEKVPTTSAEPTKGVIDSFERCQVPLATTRMFTHGTTLGLNALLTRTGARTAIITTRGFRDIYLLGRTARNSNYDITYRKPKGLLERSDTFEVTERMMYDGSVAVAFDEDDARQVASRIAERGYEAVAVAFLHAYANPEHEVAMRSILHEVTPEVAVSISSDLSREYREYERTSTAVLDAYIKPIVRSYLQDLQSEIADDGFSGQFLMMRSAGGAMTVSSSLEQPVNLILSGPAGGVVGAAGFSALVDEPHLITIDMGGTSLDASLIIGGQPVIHQGAEFEGLPINTSSLYIHTIGAGGGSIAWIDEAGGLQVGPQSAGADPGPASYGAGGTQPTFTDAALVVGYLGVETPLGGTLTLDEKLARAALAPLAEAMNMSVEALARGVVQISTMKVMGAVRSISVELGRDPKEFALLAFGGGGGLVAADVARELGMSKVIIPPGQGTFSALGMLMADVQHDLARTSLMALDTLDAVRVEGFFGEMVTEAAGVLANEGFPEERRSFSRSVDLRYTGQEHTVSVPLPAEVDNPAQYLGATFAEMHEAHYGHTMTDPVQITTFRVRATGSVEKPDLPTLERRAGGEPAPIGERQVYRGDDAPPATTTVHLREQLLAGDTISGPAVIVEHTATTVVHTGDSLVVGDHGELVITLEVPA